MPVAGATPDQLPAFRALVGRILAGEVAVASETEACRAVLSSGAEPPLAFQALCMLLEGALADPTLSVDDTHLVVGLLKGLARGAVTPEQVL